jgi:cytoskeleton-associated protein 5
VLVASTSDDEHEQLLCTLFQRFSEYGVLLNPTKCVSGTTEVTFLGYTVSSEGTRTLEENVAAINFRRFLSMLTSGSYHKPPAYKRIFTLR